ESEAASWKDRAAVWHQRGGRRQGGEVLGLYRKRPLRGSVDHIGVRGRFRYSDLKEAAGYGIWIVLERDEGGGKAVPECEGVVGLEMATGCCGSSGLGTAVTASEKTCEDA